MGRPSGLTMFDVNRCETKKSVILFKNLRFGTKLVDENFMVA